MTLDHSHGHLIHQQLLHLTAPATLLAASHCTPGTKVGTICLSPTLSAQSHQQLCWAGAVVTWQSGGCPMLPSVGLGFQKKPFWGAGV